MEECESLDSETTDLQEFQSEASETIDLDDEDEVEELQNSLREVVQDQSVKPKLQCLMVDPSFSMVTVQSEDSGIVWETASSRCSTPWASETSSTSEAYSMDGAGTAGKITIVFDEEKIVRRRLRSGGRNSRLGDRLSRLGSSRSASALGVERLEMAEISVPNVKQEKIETEPDLSEINNKDQQLFSLISEGYEILNIRVPSKLPTVDEEESTELQDNLSYLDKTPKIRSQIQHGWTCQQNHVLPEERETQDNQQPPEQVSSADTELKHASIQKENTSDIDYFEKFTLVDVVGSGEQAPERSKETEQPTTKPNVEKPKHAKNTAKDSLSASEDPFVLVKDVEIVGEHLDEVFYGEVAPADALKRRGDDESAVGAGMRMRRESQRSVKESGSVLFGSEETILTPIFISTGPPKIIDPILLEEPTAMSFMYSDLYEDAVGERRKSDEECSGAESVTSEKSYHLRLSDSEETEAYLEKFILKDETPTVDVHLGPVEDRREGRLLWSQSKFEMTGCLTRMIKEEEDKAKTEQEDTAGNTSGDLKSETREDKRETVPGDREEMQLYVVTEAQIVREVSEQSVQEYKLKEDKLGVQSESPKNSTHEPPAQQDDTEHQSEVPEETRGFTKTEQPCATQEVLENAADVVVNASHVKIMTATLRTDLPQICLSNGEADDTKTAAADEKLQSKVKAESQAEALDAIFLRERKDAAEAVPEDVAPVEVVTECDSAVRAVVELFEKAVDEKQIQTQIQIDLQDAASAQTTDVQTAAPKGENEHQAPTDETAVESQSPTFLNGVKQKSEIKTEVSSEIIEPVMTEKVKADPEKPTVYQEEEPGTDSESEKTKLIPEAKYETPTEDTGSKVHDTVNVGDELILLVPRGKAVEMDIHISQWSEKTRDTITLSEPDTTETTTTCPDGFQASHDETMTQPQVELKAEDVQKEEALPQNDLDNRHSPPTPVEEANTVTTKVESDHERSEHFFSPLRSFSPLEDLSALHRDIDIEQKAAMQKVADVSPETELHREDRQSERVNIDLKAEMQKVDQAAPEKELLREDLHSEAVDAEQRAEMQKVEDVRPETEQHREDRQLGAVDIELKGEMQKVDQAPPETELHKDDLHSEVVDAEQKEDMHEVDDVRSETELLREDLHLEVVDAEKKAEMHKVEDVRPETEQHREDRQLGAVDIELKGEMQKVDQAAPETEQHREDRQLGAVDIELKGEMQKVDQAPPETELHKEDLHSEVVDAEQKEDMHEVDDVRSETELYREDVGEEMNEAVAAVPQMIVEELEYEVTRKEDTEEMPEPKQQRDVEEPKLESDQEEEERMEIEVKMDEKKRYFGPSPEEDLIESDYDIIDAEEERQARLAAELQGMDWFCLTCGCLLSEDDYMSAEHQGHEMTAVDKAYEEIKDKLSDWISELQARSENIEDLVSELELAYNSIEDQFVETEAAMQLQNEEMMAVVMDQYNNMSVNLEDEKKAKLEQLYDQIVYFQESIDSTKATLETSTREAETDARSSEDIQARLKMAFDSAMSLELGPKGLLVFEDYARGNKSSSQLTQRKGIPVPQRPTLQPQEPGSATSTSVIVYWNVNTGDIIDCFQVYCMEDPQGAVSEEYRVTVKESYCVLEELEPDKTYKVWVMAVNYTGCSLPSERLTFRTAPSIPVIDTECCTIMWDSTTLRWSSTKHTTTQSYTLEYCRQYELEGEGLRSIAGIKSCEQKVLLQPNENYLFYIKAVNAAGASEQSEAALISTKGTRFHLLKASAHPSLELSVDQTAVHYSHDEPEDTPSTDKQCPSILGESLLAHGHYYWETIVSGSTAYRLGVAYSTADRSNPLGENNLSWCLQCIPTPSGCRYQLLHNEMQSSVFVTEMPERVGILLDYQSGRLSFYNAQSGQLFGSFCQHFTEPCHSALALETPGSLEVRMVPEMPEFTRDS